MKLNNREDELMAAYQKGDSDALEGIYTLLKPVLYSFVFRYTRDEQLSIDTVQDTFIKLQRYKGHYQPEKGKIKAYLFQIAYRLMITKLNRRKKLQSFLPFLIPIKNSELDNADRMTIREAIAKLPEIHRAVIILFYYHNMTHEEMAEILGIPKGTVKSRLHRAIQLLKDELEVDYLESGSL
jgi:RNA polymerase sigma-70 factor, ECF subfamily